MAVNRHKRDTNARISMPTLPKARYITGPIALVATLSTVGAGVMAASPETRDLLATSGSTTTSANASSSARITSPP